MVKIAAERLPQPGRLLEVGCANGYLAYIFQRLGYDVWATDASEDDRRNDLFQRAGIRYRYGNLNDVIPLQEYSDCSFDVVLMGEVFEHVLNHPAGLLKNVYRLLDRGGLLILTTPNPSTLANAVRVLRDKYLLWGTHEFLHEPKLNGSRVIDKGEIHYREYPPWILRDLLNEIGFVFGQIQYIHSGIAPAQGVAKRIIKQFIGMVGLADTRIFATGYVIWAKKVGEREIDKR